MRVQTLMSLLMRALMSLLMRLMSLLMRSGPARRRVEVAGRRSAACEGSVVSG